MALAIIIPLSMLIFSNSRITEAKETLRAEVALLRADLTKEIRDFDTRIDKRFDSMDRKLDEILRMVGDHETRMTRLEHPPH